MLEAIADCPPPYCYISKAVIITIDNVTPRAGLESLLWPRLLWISIAIKYTKMKQCFNVPRGNNMQLAIIIEYNPVSVFSFAKIN